ncbi:MAG TPA: class I SAM-dependent methyltransferase [Bryobacteraceae bacterium]|nr:class I SAM-dependent methyltransferase [Bryobacteraceae bacterium]
MLVPASEGYRIWAPTYDDGPNPLVAIESRVLGRFLWDLRGKRVLDVACGTGRWARHARTRGATVLAVDRCREMLDRCHAPAALADAQAIPAPAEWADVTICALALGYLESPMREFVRVTRRGGSIFVSDVHPKALDRKWTHSFRNGAEVYQIEHRRYSLRALLQTDGLRLIGYAEARFAAPELEIFRRAGKESSFQEMREVPAVYAAHWIKL